MKKILFAVMSVAIFCAVVMAQDVNAPVTRLGGKGDPGFHGNPGRDNPPASASNLIFYGGDTNASDPNEDAYANGNTLLVPDSTTYGAVTAPKGNKVVTTGILFNQIATINAGNIFDPATATYDIRTGVSEGNGGTDLISGSGPQTAEPTGRLPFGGAYVEYATSVAFTKNVTPTGGTTYFVNMSSQCTDASNSNCGSLQYFFDNTTQQTNGINAQDQPSYLAFFNSAYFGYTWANTCDLAGGQSALCEWQSFGIYGPGGIEQVVFYSGDFDPNNTLANGLLNQNVSGQDGVVWVPFAVEKQLTVNYVFINELFNGTPPLSAPAQWAIRNGVSEGNGGTIQCQGSGTAVSVPTGRSYEFQSVQYTEYQYTVNLEKPCMLTNTLAAGQAESHVPPPTRGGCPGGCSLSISVDTGTGNSAAVQGFLSDVEDNPPMHHIGLPNINDDSFFSSTAFGINFQPAAAEQGGVCADGSPLAITNLGCDMFSVGIGGSGQ